MPRLLARKVRMLHNPPLQARIDPKTVNAKRDNAQQKPLYPLAEQTNTRASELKLVAFDIRMLCFPALYQY